MSEANETALRRFIDAIINEGDISILDELVQPNYVYRSPDQEPGGPEALKGLVSLPA